MEPVRQPSAMPTGLLSARSNESTIHGPDAVGGAAGGERPVDEVAVGVARKQQHRAVEAARQVGYPDEVPGQPLLEFVAAPRSEPARSNASNISIDFLRVPKARLPDAPR
jgi:hypothetical protein